MTHFAVLCPSATGHVNPMSTLSAELVRRGHQVTWIGEPDGAAMAEERGFASITIGQQSFPRGSVAERMAELGELTGLRAMRYTVDWFREGTQVLLDEATAAVRESGSDALIADEAIFAARTIAELTDLPWVTLSGALAFHPDPDHPILNWRFRPTPWGRMRNRLALSWARWLSRSLVRVLAAARRRHNLPEYDYLRGNASTRALIAQMPAEFDYPRRDKPPWFHYVGALHDPAARPTVDFPLEQLDGNRPLVYASLGTVQNRVLPLFGTIAAACHRLPVQLVISLGGGARPEALGQLPGNPLVVRYAPQLQLLSRAAVVVTHAGMNTTMESLAAGVPLVAIPITNDQPAVAARVAWTGCGEVVGLRRAGQTRLARTIDRVLSEPTYRQNARRLAEANRRAGGARSAADIIEHAILP